MGIIPWNTTKPTVEFEYEIKRLRFHEAIVFPKDDVEFYMPFGYALKHIDTYIQIIKERRDGTLTVQFPWV